MHRDALVGIGVSLLIIAVIVAVAVLLGVYVAEPRERAMLAAAHAEGRDAGLSGVPVEACPYRAVAFDTGRSQQQETAWRRGWAEGWRERQEQKERGDTR